MSEESVTEELRALFEADQAERQAMGGISQDDWPAIAERDKARRERDRRHGSHTRAARRWRQ